MDPEHRLGGGGVWLDAEKKIVTSSIFVANWVAEHLLMIQDFVVYMFLNGYSTSVAEFWHVHTPSCKL